MSGRRTKTKEPEAPAAEPEPEAVPEAVPAPQAVVTLPLVPEPERAEQPNSVPPLVMPPGPPPGSRWALQLLEVNVVRGSAELTLRIRLDEADAAPLVAEAVGRERALHERTRTLTAESAEASAHAAASRRVVELDDERQRLETLLRRIDDALASATPERLGEMAGHALDAKERLKLVAQARESAGRALLDAGLAMATKAVAVALQLRSDELAVCADAERSAGGMLAAAAEQLGGLVTATSLAGVLRGTMWHSLAGAGAFRDLAGTDPPVPPMLSDPPPQPPWMTPHAGPADVGFHASIRRVREQQQRAGGAA